MKKRLLITTVLCLGLLAAGCSGNNKEAAETTAETKAESAAESASETTEAADTTGGTEESETSVPVAERPEYKALDYVTLGEYKGLEVTLSPIEVSEEEIDSEIQTALSQNDKLETVEKGTVGEGDVANIDYEGTLDGEAFEGGTDKGYDLTIGSNSFIEGFEAGLVGKEIGSDVDLNLTFPEDYGSEDLAGKEVVFHVTINSVKRVPELTDEIVAEISEDKTVAEYRETVKETLIEQKKSTQLNQKRNDLMTQVFKNSTVNSYPQELVDFNISQFKGYYESMAKQSEMEFEDFLQQNFQMSEEDFNTTIEGDVKSSLDQEMILKAVAETENITVSEEDFQAGAAKYAEQSGMEDIDAFIKQYGRAIIEVSLMQDKALEIIEENAVVHGEDAKAAESETETEAGSEAESETGAEKEAETETKTESESATKAE